MLSGTNAFKIGDHQRNPRALRRNETMLESGEIPIRQPQAEKAREKYPERLRKRIGLGVIRIKRRTDTDSVHHSLRPRWRFGSTAVTAPDSEVERISGEAAGLRSELRITFGCSNMRQRAVSVTFCRDLVWQGQ